MSYLLLEPLNKQTQVRVSEWINGKKREDSNIKLFFIRKVGKAYLFEANGEILALAYGLRERSEGNLAIYFVREFISTVSIPDEILDKGKKLIKQPTLREGLEDLKRWKAWISVEWKKKQSE